MIEKAASRSLLRAPPGGNRSTGCRLINKAYQPVGMESRRVSYEKISVKVRARGRDPRARGGEGHQLLSLPGKSLERRFDRNLDQCSASRRRQLSSARGYVPVRTQHALTVEARREESRLNKWPALQNPTCDFIGRQSRRDHDSDLITSVAMGNCDAFQELYVRYRRRLAYFIARMNRCHEDVEEIINDTFMTVWQSAGEFRHASQVSTWIFGIAYRKALRSFRRQRRHTSNVPLEDASERSTDPMQEMIMHDWLTRGLRQLPLDQRLTMQLSYKLGL